MQLEIFRPGSHTASNGRRLTFTEADLAATAEAYDPAKHEAPLVVGHPAADAPAYGWVKSLSADAATLRAEPHQVDPGFAELVEAGRYKKLSASFYLPDAEANPVPGVYYLRHVGFLGAQPPAVKGLKSAAFGEAEEGVVEFSGWEDRAVAGLFRRLREWILGQFGLEAADLALPAFDVDALQEEAARPAAAEPMDQPAEPAYAEVDPMTQQELEQKRAELEAKAVELAQREASFAEREAKLEAAQAQARRAEVAEFVEGLVRAGKVLPKDQRGLVDYLDGAEAVSFAEGQTEPREAWLRKFLAALPKAIEFGEVAGRDRDIPAAAGAAAKLDALVRAKREKNAALSYAEALAAVQTDHPELASAYAEELRA